MRRRGLSSLVVGFLTLGSIVVPEVDAAEKPTNEYCPILPDRKALPEFFSDYNGRRIYFCCEDCKNAFDANPEGLTGKALVPPSPSPSATGHVHGPGYAEWAALTGQVADATGGDHQSRAAVAAGLASAIAALLFAGWVGRRGMARGGGFAQFIVLALWTVPWGLAWYRSHKRSEELERKVSALLPLERERALDLIHFATFSDHGKPPIPGKPPIAPTLSATYYRGNDERSPKLFNSGNYRTATFHLSVRDDRGARRAGDTLTGPVHIRLEIVRAPFTPDHFWSPDRLSQIYLTADSAPDAGSEKHAVKDRTGLSEIQKTQRWRAEYSIGPVTSSTKGIVYLREQFKEGARFHYGIGYDLRIENGKLAKASDLYMDALYRTRTLSLDALPADEWLSHLPIPVKPNLGTTDAKLLGIDADKRQYRR